jgi:hypothetical protein
MTDPELPPVDAVPTDHGRLCTQEEAQEGPVLQQTLVPSPTATRVTVTSGNRDMRYTKVYSQG